MNIDVVSGKPLQKVAVIATAGTYVLAPDSDVDVITNRGAAGQVIVQLPPAKVGMEFVFYVQATQFLAVDPNGTETVALTGAAQGAGSYVQNSVVGSVYHIRCLEDGKWSDMVTRGTWAAV
jgi:hypothetical protein